MGDSCALLRTERICKSFNGVTVLKDVDMEIEAGEVHALMGENGAGKSTLIKIITGVLTKDSGEIYINGKHTDISSRQDARDAGIAVIYQELSLVPALSVYQNIFLGQEFSRYGIALKKDMRKKVKELIDLHEFDIEPDDVVETLSMAKRQMVEILKALLFQAKLIIMDEPTASLSAAEQQKLFRIISSAKKSGTSILYISHRLDEVYEVADRLTVMRNGEKTGVLDKEQIEAKQVVNLMLGKEARSMDVITQSAVKSADKVLEVKNLSYKYLLRDVSFSAYGGEVLGIGGLVGSGRTELVKCIFGVDNESGGSISLNGKPVGKNVNRNIRDGIVFVPEDRRSEGFIPKLSVERNIALASYDRLAPYFFVSRKKETRWAVDAIEKYDIRPPNRKMQVANLSGGNQQKVVVARGLKRTPKVLILDEPTAGIDVGIKAELYHIIRELADSGAIVILVSSDLAELCHVADRVLVMYDGRFFEEFAHESINQNAILLAASGVHTEEGRAL